VLGVNNSIVDEILEEDLESIEDTAGLLIDETRQALDTATPQVVARI